MVDALLPPRYAEPALLGEGGMGVVYRARDTVLDRTVAVKLVRADKAQERSLRQRLVREIRLLATLSHPGVIRVLDSGEWGGLPYYVMDYVEGVTLGAAVQASPGSVRRAVLLVAQVADALHAVHGAGILHRDVKPGNVMVAADDRAILMDFGLAVSRAVDVTALTRTGQVVGSVGFLAPETLNAQPWDVRADVFALGATAYGLLTDRMVLTPERLAQTIVKPGSVTLVPPSRFNPGVDPALDDLVLAACALDRERRTPSAAALRDGLGAWLAAPPARRSPAAPLRRPAPARRGLPGLAAGFAAVAVVGLAAVAWRGGPSMSPPAAVEAPATGLASSRAALLEVSGPPDPRELERLGAAARAAGALTDTAPEVPAAEAGAWYLARYAADHGRPARAMAALLWLLGRPPEGPAPLPAPRHRLLELAAASALVARRTQAFEAALGASGPDAVDGRLALWRAQDRALGTSPAARRRARATDRLALASLLERTLEAARPLGLAPGAGDEARGRLLLVLALVGTEATADEFFARCGEWFERPPEPSPELLVRAATLACDAFPCTGARLVTLRRWLDRALAGTPEGPDLARYLERAAMVTVRLPADGPVPPAEDPRYAEALGFLSRAASLEPSPSTKVALAATRARVLQGCNRFQEARAALATVRVEDADEDLRWWYLRVLAESLQDEGRHPEAMSAAMAAYGCCPPEARWYVASRVEEQELRQNLLRLVPGQR